jgi:hypothetical protein
MIGRLRNHRDPFEGRGARRTHQRRFVESVVAMSLALTACGLTAALWLQTLGPLSATFGGH